jgi:hypothetical protein
LLSTAFQSGPFGPDVCGAASIDSRFVRSSLARVSSIAALRGLVVAAGGAVYRIKWEFVLILDLLHMERS